jgi:hypothetical protein
MFFKAIPQAVNKKKDKAFFLFDQIFHVLGYFKYWVIQKVLSILL